MSGISGGVTLDECMSDDETYIVKRRDYARLVYDPNPEVIAQFLEQPFAFVAEFVTGMLADGPKQWAVSGGKIVQAALKGHLLEQVAKEVRDLRKKGKLEEDFGKSKYGYQSWVELLTIIDNECPDPDSTGGVESDVLFGQSHQRH